MNSIDSAAIASEVSQTSTKHTLQPGDTRKPGPWCGAAGPGRPKGRQDSRTVEVKALARAIVDDPEYRKTLALRVTLGEAPHMETLLWHYAYGKPTERIEVKDTTNEFDGITADQLRLRAAVIAQRVKEEDAVVN